MPANRMQALVEKAHRWPFGQWLVSILITRKIRFAGTAGIRIERLTAQSARLSLKNKAKVRNHIGGIHAAATALLGESASGFVFGMNLPDDKLPLLKRMHIDYKSRANGDLRCEATWTEQMQKLIDQTKGEVEIPVTITDSNGNQPVEAVYIWAFVTKKKS